MLKLAGLVAILSLNAVVGCGSDAAVAGDSSGAGGSAQGGSSNTGGANSGTGGANNVTGGDASTDDGGPFSLPDLDTACSGGPTGRQLLSFIRLPYVGTFSPPDRKDPMYPWNGPTTPSALTVGAEHKGGAVLCTVDHYMCPGGGVPCRTVNPPTISVDLDVTFKTADGVLNEVFNATAHYASNITSVGFQASLPATKIAGTFPIVAGSRDQVKLVFSGQFEGIQYRGNISEVVDQKISIPGGSWAETSAASGSDASTDH